MQRSQAVLANVVNICTISEEFCNPPGLSFCRCLYKPFISIFLLEFVVFYLLIPRIVGRIVFAVLLEWRDHSLDENGVQLYTFPVLYTFPACNREFPSAEILS
jgi:hypothetical protein